MFLIRAGTFQYAKYSKVVGLDVTGAQQAYSSVTGVAATNVITIANNSLANDMPVYWQSITGGAGFSVNTTYWVISVSGDTFKLSTTKGGSEVNFTTNITAGTLVYNVNDIYIASAPYRDIWNNSFDQKVQIGGVVNSALPLSFPSSYALAFDPDSAITITADHALTGTMKAWASDDIEHVALRQTQLKRSFWRFDFGTGATPRYGYAEVLPGDIIADNPPNTP